VLWLAGDAPFPKHPAVWYNTAQSTSERHLRALHWLQQTIRAHPALWPLTLDQAVLQALDLKAAAGRVRWLPQTHFRELTLLDGALASLPKYCTCATGVNLSRMFPAWRAAKAAWGRLAIEFQPVRQTAATFDEIATAASNTSDPQMRLFVMLLWLSCGRKGDVAKLQSTNVSLDQVSGRLTFFIEEGKGVLSRQGKCHVVSHCPTRWRQEISRTLRQCQPNTRLFRPSLGTSGEIVNLLRTANAALNCRSVRRGALQTIAATGDVSEEVLMKMSGHRQVKTLHRYLDWDGVNELAHRRAQDAARALSSEIAESLPQAQL